MASSEEMSASVVDDSTSAADGSDESLTIDAIIPATIGVLAAAFSVTVVVLIVVCRRRSCRCGASPQLHCGNGYVHTASGTLPGMGLGGSSPPISG